MRSRRRPSGINWGSMTVIFFLNLDFNVNKEQVLKLQEAAYRPKKNVDDEEGWDNEEDEDEEIDEKLQKVVLFANKMGIIGEDRVDVDKHIKLLIEDLYTFKPSYTLGTTRL